MGEFLQVKTDQPAEVRQPKRAFVALIAYVAMTPRLRFRCLPPQTATPPQPNNDGHCGDVALSNPPSAKMETIDI